MIVRTGEAKVTLKMQAALFLRDTPAEAGAFRCVKGFHHRFAEWSRATGGSERWPTAQGGQGAVNHPEPTSIVPQYGELTDIAAGAGDLVVWHSYVPHGTAANTTADAVRLAVYVSLAPPESLPPEMDMAAEWASPKPFPSWDSARGGIVQRQAEPAVLTALGRSLLGLETGRDSSV